MPQRRAHPNFPPLWHATRWLLFVMCGATGGLAAALLVVTGGLVKF